MKRNINFLYTYLIVLFPILSVYYSGIPSISIADLLLIIFFILAIPILLSEKVYLLKESIPILVLVLYIIFNTIINIIFVSHSISLLSNLRYILYLLCLLFMYKYFDIETGIKVLRLFTMLATVYIIIQFLFFNVFGVVLPSYIPGLAIMDNNFLIENRNQFFYEYYRPTSFFLEPTHYVQYCLPYISILFFSEGKMGKITVIETILVILGIVCSGSSVGFIMLALLVLLKSLSYLKNDISLKKIVLLVSLLLISLVLYNNVPMIQNSLMRMKSEDGTFTGAAVQYRFNNVLDNIRDSGSLILGSGRGSEEGYLTGFFYTLNSLGLIGVSIYIISFITFYYYSNRVGRNMIIIIFVLFIGSEYIVNFGILYYFSFIQKFDRSNN